MTAKGVGFALLGVALVVGTRTAAAQEPAGPPPPSSRVEDRGTAVLELLPAIGRIGAQAGLMAGPSRNPYGVGRGVQAAGYLDVPLGRVAGGKVSYEILVGLSHAKSGAFLITDPVAYVANLAAGASPASALAGPPGAPFPVQRRVRTRLRLLEVVPFGLKYTVTALDHLRLRPYASAGADVVVVITRQTPEQDESLLFRGTSPFDGPLIGGLVSQAPELQARGIPTGQGDIEAGFHAGGGVELRLSKGVSVNLDYRLTGIGGAGSRLHAFSSGLGVHW
jgi:opacity protein-like surface antigen